MTNEEYRKLRGTNKPFTATDLQAKRRWYAMNKQAIKHRRKKNKARQGKTRWTRLDGGMDPERYALDCEE